MARIDDFMKGLEIMKPYFADTNDFMSADHGETVLFAYLDELTPESEDGVQLAALGFVPNDVESWTWME